jgi:hypothetical protein
MKGYEDDERHVCARHSSLRRDDGVRTAAPQQAAPIIDMHMHAYHPDFLGPAQPNPLTGSPAPETEADIRRRTLEMMDRHNIASAVLSGPLDVVDRWLDAAPARFLRSPHFPYFAPCPDLAALRPADACRWLRRQPYGRSVRNAARSTQTTVGWCSIAHQVATAHHVKDAMRFHRRPL